MKTEQQIREKIEQFENVLKEIPEQGLASEFGRGILKAMANALKWVIEEK